jgi:hypothetical protein
MSKTETTGKPWTRGQLTMQLASQLKSGGLDAKSAFYAAMDIMADLKVTPEWRARLGDKVANAIDGDLGDPKTWSRR